ncbi:MAG: hypothetical protein ACO22U_13305 [bacterium]
MSEHYLQTQVDNLKTCIDELQVWATENNRVGLVAVELRKQHQALQRIRAELRDY